MLFLLFMLGFVQQPFDIAVDYPLTVDGMFDVSVNIINNAAVLFEGTISCCLDKACMPNESFSVKASKRFNYSFDPKNITMKLKVAVNGIYGKTVIEKTIKMKDSVVIPKNISKTKANTFRMFPIPTNASMVYSTGEDKKRSLGILMLCGLCVFIAMVILWRK